MAAARGAETGAAAFRFDGKRALVVGGATGMGAAAAAIIAGLGAEVAVIDNAPITLAGVRAISGDLRERESIDAALDAAEGQVDVLLSCAGVADGTPGIEQANFIGHRHLIERLMAAGRMPKGSAIGMISSTAGLGWETQLPLLSEYLSTPDFDAATKWIAEHPGTATYGWSKRAMSAYVARQAYAFLRQGIRINAIMPGPTNTPLARANADTWLAFAKDYRDDCGIVAASPAEQAYPLVFLCSDAASHINGVNLIVDAGYTSAGFTGTFDAPAVRMMMGVS